MIEDYSKHRNIEMGHGSHFFWGWEENSLEQKKVLIVKGVTWWSGAVQVCNPEKLHPET